MTPTVDSPESAGESTTFLRYSDDLETPRPDEAELIKGIADALHANNDWAFKKYHHGIRDAHAKSHGILRGELTVYPGLPPHLAQGLFAAPATYPLIARLSSTSGALRTDATRGVRGLGIKLLGVEGPRALADDTAHTQDFILVTHREFPFPDAHAYLKRGMPMAWLLARSPDAAMLFVGRTLGAVQNVLKRAKLSLPTALELFSEPNSHILGLTFWSSAPIRYGEHVAKFQYVPLSASVKSLVGQPVPAGAGPDAFRDQVVKFFSTSTAEYELQVQLCTDPVTMPIEDATVAWPEEDSPHVGVAKITFGLQDPDTAARRRFGDDVLSFNSWRGLAAHRPLGSINRLKKLVYEASSDFRHRMNNVARVEPADVTDLPD